jgi:PAS domain S-box-containing protein
MRIMDNFVSNWFRNVSIKEKLYFVLGIMAFLIAAELFILYFTIHTLSSTRAFVGGEGLYSKAQKDAAYSLRKYAITLDEKDYRSYQAFLHITQGDRKARLELEKEKPDEEIVYAGFLQARNNRDDINEMIHLFKRFRHISYINKAISIWAKGDSAIERLEDVAIRLHVLISTNAPTKTKPGIDRLVEEIDLLNQQLTILEDDFSYTLGEGSRWLENLIMMILFFVALTVELTGLYLTISISRGITHGLDEIIRASSQVGRADFTSRAVIRSKDELGRLAGSFNQMVNDLQQKTEEQILAQESLRRQKDLYETLVVAQSEMGEGVVITQDDAIVFANKALCNMYGYSEEEILSLPSYIDLVPAHEQLKLSEIRKNRLLGNEISQTGETSVVRKDGKIIDIEYSRKVISVGNITQIVSIVRDVTGQKISEKKMEELAAIVEASDDAIKTLSMEGIILNWNKGAEKLYGYSSGEITGKHVSLLSISGMEDEFAHLTNKIRNKEFIDHYESIRKRKDGSPICVSVTASPILGRDGKVTSIAIIARDITASKKSAAELRKKSDELVRSNTDLEQFAYVVSHDLREPLRTMASYVQLLQARYTDKLDRDANEFIEFTVDGAKRMNELINDLLSYSRVGYSLLQFEKFETAEIIGIVQNNLHESILLKKAEITCADLPEIYASRLQIIQLFQNLIGNAIKFSGAAVPKICIQASRSESGWLFSVSDNGIGIEKKYVERIFVIFQRLHGIGEYEGTGIGLAICKKIAERHGGDIWCESTAGKGSVFFFTLNTFPPPDK